MGGGASGGGGGTSPFARLSRGVREEGDLRWLFDFIDVDRSGTIERKELLALLSTRRQGDGQRLSSKQIDELVRYAGGENISFESFARALKEFTYLTTTLSNAYRVVFVTGGPGSGKGTLCAKLVEHKGDRLEHVSSGDLLRDEVKRNTELGQRVAALMQQGALVSASIVLALLDARLSNAQGKVVLLDGFPRSLDNARDFYNDFGPAEGILLFDCPEEEMVRRIVERGKVSGRADDNEATARKRVAIFKEQSEAPTQFLISKGIPVTRIDTTRPVEENLRILLNKF